MGGGIDTEGQAADDGQALAGQRPGEVFGGLQALRRRIAAADHGQPAFPEQGGVAADVEQAGRIGDFEQGLGVGVVGQGQDMLPGLVGPGNATVDCLGGVKIEQQVGAVADDAARCQTAGGEDGLG